VEKVRITARRNAAPSYAIIDSQNVKTISATEERGINEEKKTKNASGQIIVYTMGNLLTMVVHVANIHNTKSLLCTQRNHLKSIHLLKTSALMLDTAKHLSRIFPMNWTWKLIFQRVSSRNRKSCQKVGLSNVSRLGSKIPHTFPKTMKFLFVLLKLCMSFLLGTYC